MGIVLGFISYLGLCGHGHLGQCISQFARGSALAISSVFLLVVMRVCGPAMFELRRPPELYESVIMMTFGLIGIFTEHNFPKQCL
ncbi:hypothetical protein LPJ66_001891 [Kickxella alabastrina]|uniref:Uncharacterized protein n=1 Tax=Kickxella alabastrina TaxID=61397 RepID=A0ACC1IS28_9FUNG|nr:hypothetical protein LPJ66_001891 [Kickxella alabastrina]